MECGIGHRIDWNTIAFTFFSQNFMSLINLWEISYFCTINFMILWRNNRHRALSAHTLTTLSWMHFLDKGEIKSYAWMICTLYNAGHALCHVSAKFRAQSVLYRKIRFSCKRCSIKLPWHECYRRYNRLSLIPSLDSAGGLHKRSKRGPNENESLYIAWMKREPISVLHSLSE